jgi:hypothetical protein
MGIPIRLNARVLVLAWRRSHQHPKKPELIAHSDNVGERACGRASKNIEILDLMAASRRYGRARGRDLDQVELERLSCKNLQFKARIVCDVTTSHQQCSHLKWLSFRECLMKPCHRDTGGWRLNPLS